MRFKNLCITTNQQNQSLKKIKLPLEETEKHKKKQKPRNNCRIGGLIPSKEILKMIYLQKEPGRLYQGFHEKYGEK